MDEPGCKTNFQNSCVTLELDPNFTIVATRKVGLKNKPVHRSSFELGSSKLEKSITLVVGFGFYYLI